MSKNLSKNIKPLIYMVELTIVSSLLVTPLIISVFRGTSQLKIGLMAGLPVLIAAGIFAKFGYDHRKTIWFIGIVVGIGFSLLSTILIGGSLGSPLILLVTWTGMLFLTIIIIYFPQSKC